MAETRERVRALISGRVQGVFFRDSARGRATELGLDGWVRNLSDGRVEVVVEGPPERVQEMLAWCARGPERADVSDVETHNEDPTGEREGFRVR